MYNKMFRFFNEQVTQRERNHHFLVDDVARVIEESLGSEFLRLVPDVGVHVSRVQVGEYLCNNLHMFYSFVQKFIKNV